MRVIYVDVLLAINLVVNYLLLFAAARLSGTAFNRLRGLLGAAIGAAYSLIILAELPALLLTISKFAVSLLMLTAAFGWRGFGDELRLAVFFYGASFVFAGLMFLVQLSMHPPSFFYQNGVVYYELSAVEIALSATAAFILVEAIRRLFRHGAGLGSFKTIICYGGRSVAAEGFLDSGNSLTEPFSGAPVAVCPADILSTLLEPELLIAMLNAEKGVPEGFRVVPCKTASGASLLAAFRPDRFVVIKNGREYEAENLFVAVSTELSGGQVLIGPNMVLKAKEIKEKVGEK